jgi:hypothetical protein
VHTLALELARLDELQVVFSARAARGHRAVRRPSHMNSALRFFEQSAQFPWDLSKQGFFKDPRICIGPIA